MTVLNQVIGVIENQWVVWWSKRPARYHPKTPYKIPKRFISHTVRSVTWAHPTFQKDRDSLQLHQHKATQLLFLWKGPWNDEHTKSRWPPWSSFATLPTPTHCSKCGYCSQNNCHCCTNVRETNLRTNYVHVFCFLPTLPRNYLDKIWNHPYMVRRRCGQDLC